MIYIPQLKDQLIELPNGEKVKHDGYFFAGDTGSAIKKNHIDLFTGVSAVNPFLVGGETFEGYVVVDPATIQTLIELHKN